ncbi:MAG TPA: DUF3471 domain-containing protein, partial [Flavisolibacter sp.]|nr:DUF3471 domain-containing protein [Flavisolibacter sp.]
EEKLGITILTNNDNQSFFELLRYQIIRAYLNMPYLNLSQNALKGFNKRREEDLKNVAALQSRVKGNRPALPLSAYTGNYDNPLFGNIVITEEKNNLKIRFPRNRNLTATLQYLDNNEWLLTYSNPAFGIFPLKFKTEGNKVLSTDVKVNDFLEYDPYTFTKK